jgi:hypothetical protein
MVLPDLNLKHKYLLDLRPNLNQALTQCDIPSEIKKTLHRRLISLCYTYSPEINGASTSVIIILIYKLQGDYRGKKLPAIVLAQIGRLQVASIQIKGNT